jgi:UDP-N-acetylglucosamine 2-epimerase (non-hydrolysing)/GDP/UDP-N,N'-diacetylbacillosamine 2-epimerase (hydrolysing)
VSAAPRRICVVTGGRADYGLLRPLMRLIQAEPALELQVAVTGMHLSPAHGLGVAQIERDGLPISARVEMLLSSDTNVGMAKATGLGVIGFADAFARLRPDLVVVLGDRFEILAAVQASLLLSIPVAHLHGGEASEGAVDESIRHAITKMAHLHFVSAQEYYDRVVQMGEDPAHVFNVGAPGLDNIIEAQLPDRSQLERALKVTLRSPLVVMTYHPVTLSPDGGAIGFTALLDALDGLKDVQVIATRPNADAGGRRIGEQLDAWAAAHSDRAHVFTDLGTTAYLGLVRQADAVVGNSSSGIIEVPALGKPTVNIGPRQQGRLRGPSIIDCVEQVEPIRAALTRALSEDFRKLAARSPSPHGAPGKVSPRIVDVLKTVPLAGLTLKRFHSR